MRRARLEGRQIGRRPIEVDRQAALRHRAHGAENGAPWWSKISGF